MKTAAKPQLICRSWMAVLLSLTTPALAQLEVTRFDSPSGVFGGAACEVKIFLRNPIERPLATNLRTRLYQLSSATRMPVGEAEPWKSVTVLAGQTVLETVSLKFPNVRATTRFEIRWFDDADRPVGQTPVTVFPTNLLKQLAEVAGEKPPGIFDPHRQLTPLLRALRVEFDDLNQGERLTTWHGRLAILGPFDAKRPAEVKLLKQAEALAARGTGVLMFALDDGQTNSALPTPTVLHQTVMIRSVGGRRLVTAPSGMIAGLAAEPLAQVKLLELAWLAVGVDLPRIETQL